MCLLSLGSVRKVKERGKWRHTSLTNALLDICEYLAAFVRHSKIVWRKDTAGYQDCNACLYRGPFLAGGARKFNFRLSDKRSKPLCILEVRRDPAIQVLTKLPHFINDLLITHCGLSILKSVDLVAKFGEFLMVVLLDVQRISACF